MAGDGLVEFVDQRGQRFKLDTSLEVVVDGRVGYIEGNAHTFPGRMTVYVPSLGHCLTRSPSEVESMNETTRWWISGFLAGCEPDIFTYLGIDPADDQGAEPTPADYERWRAFVARCRDAGEWPRLDRRPRTPLVIAAEERAELRVEGDLRAWALAGERVWVPEGTRWVEAVPQPALVEGFMPGTVCAERRGCDLLDLVSGWLICLDCGEVTPPD